MSRTPGSILRCGLAEFVGAAAPGWRAARRGGGLAALSRSRTGMLGAAIVAAAVLCATFAPVLAPYNTTRASLAATLRPPTSAHPFGTDQSGRDVLSRVIFGPPISPLVGAVTVFVAGVIGCGFGL